MPLVNAMCTNCNGNLQVDSSKDAAICPYCGSAYIVEKAVNNYNITNNNTNNNTNYINSANINMGSDSVDQLAEAAMKCVKAQQYSMAQEYFIKISKQYPSDYRGPLGELICYSKNWTEFSGTYEQLLGWDKIFQKVFILSPKEIGEEIRPKYNIYRSTVEEEKRKYEARINQKEQERLENLRKKEQEEQEMLEYIREKRRMEYRAQKRCQNCGGFFHGVFRKKCGGCGREKDY